MQARYYDPVIGRFYSNDPVDTLSHVEKGNIHGFGRFTYGNNNPYRYTDPDGKESRLVVQQEANTQKYLDGKITREEAQQNSYDMAGGDLGKAIVDELSVMGLVMDVADNLAAGDVPISEAAGVAGEAGAGAITEQIQKDLGSGGGLRAEVIRSGVKFIVEYFAGDQVEKGTEKIDELANKELDQN